MSKRDRATRNPFYRPQSQIKFAPADNRKHVIIFVYCGQERDHWLEPHLTSTIASAFLTYQHKYLFSYQPIYSIHPVTAARNRSIEIMYETEERAGRKAEWVVMFDNDIGPPQNVWDVLESAPSEADIVILPYWVWTSDYPMPCVGQWKDNLMVTPQPDEMKAGWNEIGCGGTGAMFIRRRVFEDGRITKPYFKIKYDDIKAQAMSEDIYFTGMCKDAGLRLFTNTDYVCSHYRTLDLAQVNLGMCKLTERIRTEMKKDVPATTDET